MPDVIVPQDDSRVLSDFFDRVRQTTNPAEVAVAAAIAYGEMKGACGRCGAVEADGETCYCNAPPLTPEEDAAMLAALVVA